MAHFSCCLALEGSPPPNMTSSSSCQKKGRRIDIPVNMSFADYVKTKGDSEKDSGHQRKKLRASIEDRLTVDGACGRILRSMDLNLEDGQTYKWHTVQTF